MNEGQEVENTVVSINDTVGTQCKIMLINDASTDSFDYKAVADKYGCIYIEHSQRVGVACSRQQGVELCDTPFFLLLDAHMRFYEKGWDVRLISYLTKYPRAVLCSQTRFLSKLKNGKIEDRTGDSVSCAGYIDFECRELFRVAWNKVDTEPLSNVVEIPCIIGAAYACNKDYWQRIDGLNGLITYGTDEELISIKVWTEGGRCLLVKDWVVGHIYRKSFPYPVPHIDTIYNRLFTAELLLPYEVKRILFLRIRQSYASIFDEAYAMLKANYSQIRKQKKYIRSISEDRIKFFIEWNGRVARLNLNQSR